MLVKDEVIDVAALLCNLGNANHATSRLSDESMRVVEFDRVPVPAGVRDGRGVDIISRIFRDSLGRDESAIVHSAELDVFLDGLIYFLIGPERRLKELKQGGVFGRVPTPANVPRNTLVPHFEVRTRERTNQTIGTVAASTTLVVACLRVSRVLRIHQDRRKKH